MTIHKLFFKQFLNIPLKEAWDFFSSPKNLAVITPPDLDFNILTKISDSLIYTGLEIDYTVKPFFSIPVKWKTIISEVEELKYFVDKQLKGPYKIWEHLHKFSILNDGTMMTDEVKYQLPYGIMGNLIHKLIVRRRIEEIFTYRRETLEKMFNKRIK